MEIKSFIVNITANVFPLAVKSVKSCITSAQCIQWKQNFVEEIRNCRIKGEPEVVIDKVEEN